MPEFTAQLPLDLTLLTQYTEGTTELQDSLLPSSGHWSLPVSHGSLTFCKKYRYLNIVMECCGGFCHGGPVVEGGMALVVEEITRRA